MSHFSFNAINVSAIGVPSSSSNVRGGISIDGFEHAHIKRVNNGNIDTIMNKVIKHVNPDSTFNAWNDNYNATIVVN